jgi:hypothetical protein
MELSKSIHSFTHLNTFVINTFWFAKKYYDITTKNLEKKGLCPQWASFTVEPTSDHIQLSVIM